MTAVQRLFKNTISENSDQECIDIILGKHGLSQQHYSTNSKMQLFINKELIKQESLFTSLDFLKINVSTWNMGGVLPMESTDLSKWLLPFDQSY